METADGYAIDGADDHWTVRCPHCDHEHECKGFFDSTEVNKCQECLKEFTTRLVWKEWKAPQMFIDYFNR